MKNDPDILRRCTSLLIGNQRLERRHGDVLNPHRIVGSTALDGDSAVSSAGTLRIEIEGTSNHDVLEVNGLVDLNSDAGAGATLDIALGFAASIGDTFLFLENDEAEQVASTFNGLAQNGQIDVEFGGDTFRFEIDYMAGDGNDVSLEVIDIL